MAKMQQVCQDIYTYNAKNPSSAEDCILNPFFLKYFPWATLSAFNIKFICLSSLFGNNNSLLA